MNERSSLMHPARAAVLAVGSAGDVAPLAAIAARLQSRGIDTTLVAPQRYASLAQRSGLPFASIGADDVFDAVFDGPDVWHPMRGLEASWRYYGAALRSGLSLLRERWRPSDTVLVSSSFAVAARVAEESLGFAKTTVHLSPAVMFSRDRPARWAGRSIPEHWPRGVQRWLAGAAERFLIDPVIAAQVDAVRDDLGLPRRRAMFSQWIHSPRRVAWLFPKWFAPAAPDWPASGRHAGFAIVPAARGPLPDPVERFLSRGTGPVVVVTAGTAVASRPAWVDLCVRHALERGARVVHVTPTAQRIESSADKVLAVPFVPFHPLLERAQLLVHHGGIGTAVDAMRAGIAQWVFPTAHDQPDNAVRLQRLDAAAVLPVRPSHRQLESAWAAAQGPLRRAAQSLRAKLRCEGDGADRVAGWVTGEPTCIEPSTMPASGMG